MTGTSVLILGFLLLAPVWALSRLTGIIDARVLAGVPVAMSVFAFLAFRSDKRRGEAGAWRIPESTLHLISLFGGWPGAFLAQRAYRHKVSKMSFQFVFWSIVLMHQGAAVDALAGWSLAREAWRLGGSWFG